MCCNMITYSILTTTQWSKCYHVSPQRRWKIRDLVQSGWFWSLGSRTLHSTALHNEVLKSGLESLEWLLLAPAVTASQLVVGGSFLCCPRRKPADHLLLDLEADPSSIQQGPESSLESICIVGAIHSLTGKCHRRITGQGRKLVRRLSLYHVLSQRLHSKYCHLQWFPFLLNIMEISGGSISCKTPCRP